MSITGALRLGGTFLARFPLHLGMKSVFVPNPTTGEDARALHEAGLDVKLYRFFDRANGGVDFPGMCEDLAQAPEQSIVLLHVSGSSPTGASLVISQWRALIDIIKVCPGVQAAGARLILVLSGGTTYSPSRHGVPRPGEWRPQH